MAQLGFEENFKVGLVLENWFLIQYIWLTKSPTDAKPRDVVRNITIIVEMRNSITIFILILFSISCKREIKKNDKPNFKWTEYKSKDSIPKQLIKVLKALNGNEKIANFNEEYEATDNIEDTLLPTRQLKLLTNKNENWRLVYEQGGIGTSYFYVQCKIRNDSLYELKIANTLLAIENNDSISKYLKENKLQFQNIKTINK